MKTALNLLAVCRGAERASAMGKLASARRELGQAQAMQLQARASVAQAHAWWAELTSRCALGEHNTLRESALPACVALLEREKRTLMQQDAMVRSAHAHMLEQRQEMQRCERAVMRIDEWKLLTQTQERRDQSALEDRQTDDLEHRRPVSARGNP